MARNQSHTRIRCPTANNDDMKRPPTLMRFHGPRCTSTSMSSGLVCCEGNAAQSDCIVVVQSAVHVRWRKARKSGIEVRFSPAFDHIHIALHDHILRSRLFEHLGPAGRMIVVRLAVQQDLYISPPKAKLFNAASNLRWRRLEVGIDQDVALRSRDEISGKIARSD